MACLNSLQEHDLHQKGRKETVLFHPKERLVVWILFAVLAIARIRVAALYNPDDFSNLIGDTHQEIEKSIAAYCSSEIYWGCQNVPRRLRQFRHKEDPTTIRLEVQSGGPCESVLAAQEPLLSFLAQNSILYQVDCPSNSNKWDDDDPQPPAANNEEAQSKKDEEPQQRILDNNDPISPEEEEALKSFYKVVLRAIMLRGSSNAYPSAGQRKRQQHLILDSMLEILTTSQVERVAQLSGEETYSKIRVGLFLEHNDNGYQIPTGRLDRDYLIHQLSEIVTRQEEKSINGREPRAWQIQETKDVVEMLKVPISPLPPSQTLAPLPRSPFHRFSQQSESVSCVQRLYNQNHLTDPNKACSKVLVAANEKRMELEIVWDCPLAIMLLWIYIILSVGSLCVLSSDVGLGETPQQRRRRHFRQMIRDPVLRKRTEQDVRERLQNDEQAVAKYMAEQDARAAEIEAADADEEWRRSEAKLVAWDQRVQFLQVFRIALTIASMFSFGLLFIDKPKTGRLLDGLLVVVLAFGLTYTCLPGSPTQQSKKGTKLGLEEPLLGSVAKDASGTSSV